MKKTEAPGLDKLVDSIINALTRDGEIREGTVMGANTGVYRRLDCRGKALAYLRQRPRKGAVRIDVSTLWRTVSAPGEIVIPAAACTALLVRTPNDADKASHSCAAWSRTAINRSSRSCVRGSLSLRRADDPREPSTRATMRAQQTASRGGR